MKTESWYLYSVGLSESGKYKEAISAFTELGDYKDSQDYLTEEIYKNMPGSEKSSIAEKGNYLSAETIIQ